MKKSTYGTEAKVWLYPSDTASWHFVTLPKELGAQIKELFGKNAKGFGSLPVEVKIRKTIWQTSIFADKYSGSYILPLKAKVRKAEEVEVGDTIAFTIKLL
jgi:hypothetical protein